ncbi:MAG: O-succinylbenzoate synthase [Polyangiaceae bacterium]|nr:O-succinylbenzoate synthase [Polyangiaceae bacterium]
MKLIALRVRGFAGRLERGLTSSQHTWQERRGLLLEIEDELGHIGLGEASPLPRYSPDDVAGCRGALESLGARWPQQWPEDPALALAALRRLTPGMAETPAARCAVETALLDLLGHRLGMPLWHVLAQAAGLPVVPARVSVAVLIHASDGEPMDRELGAVVAQGYGSVKLKVGGMPLERDQRRIARVLDRLGGHVRLRLDANRAWPPCVARDALAGLADPRIEYVEEPVAQGRWADLGPTPVLLAADETLQGPSPEVPLAQLQSWGVGVIVVKPMALGLLASLSLALQARSMGMAVVVSHLLDGPVGWAASISLALALGADGPAHGLAPHAGLTAWPASRPLAAQGPELVATAEPGLGLDHTDSLRAGS